VCRRYCDPDRAQHGHEHVSVAVGKSQNLERLRVRDIKKFLSVSVSVSIVRYVKFRMSVSVGSYPFCAKYRMSVLRNDDLRTLE
jgi:hypothetical protein